MQQNNQNTALTELNERYRNCNLLMPMASEAQLNPYYKLTVMEVKTDLSETSGDIFKVGSVKGTNGQWSDTFSPAKPLLMKIAAAAGIQFDPNNTGGSYISKNCYKARAYGAIRLPDGTAKTHCDEKVINLEDEEDRLRLEFMDKSIEGIKDKKAADEAAKMFAGEWRDSEDKWGKPCKAFFIADSDRQKYIDRSLLVNMTLLRKTFAEKAMTGAINRVIRALTGLKGQYTRAELQKPFAIPRVTFSPDYTNPDVQRLMLAQGMSSVSNLFGGPGSMVRIGSGTESHEVIDSGFNPDEFADNPAFASDTAYDDLNTPDVPDAPVADPAAAYSGRDAGYDSNNDVRNPDEYDPLRCSECGRDINERTSEYSRNKYGRPLCYQCQGKGGAQS